jgi:5-methyltetrahydropteroyltriglutamate--homocysteine methyltransferase
MRAAGLTQVACNDFSLYDHMLDMAVTLGAVPERFRRIDDPLARYFAMARGRQDRAAGVDVAALEMTKWFDTNYHYIVPELGAEQAFVLDPTKITADIAEARAAGVDPRPVIVGPVTFLRLSKMTSADASIDALLSLLDRLLPLYMELLRILADLGVGWVQIDEPCLALDLTERERAAYRQALGALAAQSERPRLLLASYFGAYGDNLSLAAESAWDGLHVDLVRAPDELPAVLERIGPRMVLSAGVVDGRNVWRTDLDRAHGLIRRAVAALGADRVWASSSCSLLHAPVDLSLEETLDPELASWLAFATQKLDEIATLADAADLDVVRGAMFEQSRTAVEGRRLSSRTRNAAVRARADAVTAEALRRDVPYAERARRQAARLHLPLFPTTTIGSFPQTTAVREARASWRARRLSDADYRQFLEAETRRCVEWQDAIGLDVLVHGEFERTDMVEYFGEQLDGFAFTEHGWVQSYGSRCVKPPVLYGDVSRPAPMAVGWARFAQSLTSRPVKGMLTGPVTILQWSFVRDDQPRRDTCRQIALALRDEVHDLEAAGIAVIQVDEPAIREGLPLRRSAWRGYLEWAVDAFRLATSGVAAATQVHTHMCYSEFGDILPAIAAMDADVLSIETSRSHMELLRDVRAFAYPNAIGPGVYDIHSPRVPSVDEMIALLRRAREVLPANHLWVNPDCGLKTRGWPEVDAALRHLVQAAAVLRAELTAPSPAGAGA